MPPMFAPIRDWLKQSETVREIYGKLYSNYCSYRATVLEKLRTLRFPLTVRHIYGPKRISASKDDLIVVSLVCNGEQYIDEFFDHYLSLGAKHIVLLDNGSEDNTISLAKNNSKVSIFYSDAEFNKYETIMRRYIIDKFSGDNWVLCVDIDEFFDYPHSSDIKLTQFLKYLNKKGFNAVCLQMLDMFPLRPREIESTTSFRESHVYYDTSNISSIEYKENPLLKGNKISNKEIKTYREGIRQEIFEMKEDQPLLSKHWLLRMKNGLNPSNIRIHHVDNAHIADVSCVLYHYKYRSDFPSYVKEVVENEIHSESTMEEYKYYLEKLESEEDYTSDVDMQKIESTQQLVNSGFIKVSKDYIDYTQSKKDK